MNEKFTFTVKEMAKKIDVSTATVYSMVRDNQIPHVRVRSKIIFHAPTINAWLAGEFEGSKEVNKP